MTLSGLENTEQCFVGSASADKIWAVLTTEERTRFTRAVQDSDSELAKTILTSPDLAEDIPAPWWMWEWEPFPAQFRMKELDYNATNVPVGMGTVPRCTTCELLM